jgi:hypothetical protein
MPMSNFQPVPNCPVIHELALRINDARTDRDRVLQEGFDVLEREQAHHGQATAYRQELEEATHDPDISVIVASQARLYDSLAKADRSNRCRLIDLSDIYSRMAETPLKAMDAHAGIHRRYGNCMETSQDIARGTRYQLMGWLTLRSLRQRATAG